MSKKNIDETKAKKAVDDIKETAAEAEKAAAPASGAARKFKYGSVFYVIIALVIAVVVVLNVVVNMLAKRSPIKIDLTPDNRYELTEESINIVRNMDKDVEIVVTASKDYFANLRNYYESMYAQYYGSAAEMPYEMIPELLDKYAMYAAQGKGSITVKYVDMDIDPDLINKYKDYYNGDISRGSIMVYADGRLSMIYDSEVATMLTPDQTASKSGQMKFNFTGESDITGAICNVIDTHPIRVAFAKKMNNSSMYDKQMYDDSVNGSVVETFEKEILGKHGYDCTDIDIAKDEISPDDYDMLVVYAPSVDFTEDIIKKMSDFLYNDGKYDRNMIYVPDYSKTNLPNIEEFLADWSIKVENRIIADDTNAITSPTNILLEITDVTAVGGLPQSKTPIVAPYSRELTQITKNNEDIVSEALKSSAESYTADLTDKNAELGEKGARNVIMVSKKQHSDNLVTHTSSLLVIGSPFMTDSTVIMQNQTYNNANVLTIMINTLTGKEDNGVVIPDKNLQQSFISVTTKQAKNVQLIVILLIPFIIAVTGVIVLLRRRNR